MSKFWPWTKSLQILNLTTNLAHLHSFSMFLPKESLKNLNLRGRFFDDCADLNPKFAEKTLAIFPQLRHYYEPFYNLIRSRQFAEYSVTGIAAELGTFLHGSWLLLTKIMEKKIKTPPSASFLLSEMLTNEKFRYARSNCSWWSVFQQHFVEKKSGSDMFWRSWSNHWLAADPCW